MTDKIMIDGVDVSGCDFYRFSGIDNTCGLYKNSEGDNLADCDVFDTCLYKQLARKTEECERLKTEIIKGGGTLSDKVRAEVFTTLENELQAEKQKVKELEKELALFKTTSIMIDNNQYRTALKEIKKHIDKQCLKCRNSTFDDEYCAEERCAVWEILQRCEVINE